METTVGMKQKLVPMPAYHVSMVLQGTMEQQREGVRDQECGLTTMEVNV